MRSAVGIAFLPRVAGAPQGKVGEDVNKEIRGSALAVAHEGATGAFMVYPGEYEAIPDQG